ncbi:MAG TPA: dihydrofolate reductase [Ferruginibacter sp.]|nr:dihydrofolate reductase [Ferruginibacter sp.]
MITLIVAASTNHAIGKDGQLLWHLPNDLKFFKNSTWGLPVIMGRKTFESVNKPLPGRFNIVVTQNPNWPVPAGVWMAGDLRSALQQAVKTGAKECFIIGGGEIYQQALPMADRVLLTRVHATLEGDAFFPELKESDWMLERDLFFPSDEKHAYPYSFQTWIRRR